MAQSPSAIICEAIRHRALLQFDYHGKPRVVAPYCYGVSNSNSDVLRAIQLRGDGSFQGSGKLWTVSDMLHLNLLDETFTPNDPHYNPNDTAMKSIYCRI